MASCLFVAAMIMIFIFECKAADNCVYNDPDSGYTLDLDYFEDMTISSAENAVYYFNYTVCKNSAHVFDCSWSGNPVPEVAMVWYYEYNTASFCAAVTLFDDFNFQPTYTAYNKTWYFYYHNGPSCYEPALDNLWITEIFWICDNTTEYKVTNTVSICHLKLYIHSKYACPTVPPLNNTCAWRSEIGDNILNLTTVSKDVIVGQDASNISLIFLYTPCNNDLACGATKAMAILEDFETNSCNKYLALWEGVHGADMNVNYDKANNGSWQFVFTNGEKCDDYESIFEVYWFCDRNVIPFRLISSTATGICSSQMVITSYLACS
eukprot:359551_1